MTLGSPEVLSLLWYDRTLVPQEGSKATSYWLYTGSTRGKKLVVLVGQRKALAIAVRNNRTENRFSGLLVRLGMSNGRCARLPPGDSPGPAARHGE